MIQNIELECIADQLQCSEAGSITGPIWFRIGEESFPHTQWNDFAVVLLLWWIQQIDAFEIDRSRAVLSFMDGPYEVRLSEYVAGECSLSGVERRKEDLIRIAARVNVSELLNSIFFRAKETLDESRKRHWSNNDLLALEALIESRDRHR